MAGPQHPRLLPGLGASHAMPATVRHPPARDQRPVTGCRVYGAVGAGTLNACFYLGVGRPVRGSADASTAGVRLFP
jgi:hypothetical protein